MSDMSINNWVNLFLLIAAMCAVLWMYMQYRKLLIDGDIKGQLVFKWMVRIGVILYILSMIYNLLCHLGIIDHRWYVRWLL